MTLAGAALSLGAGAVQAQDARAPLDMLISTVQDDAGQHLLGLPGPDLAALLSGAHADERLQMVSALPTLNLERLVHTLAQSNAAPDLIAGLVTAAIMADPASGIRNLITANFQPEELRPVAVVMIEDIGDRCATLDPEALEAMLLAIMSFDRRAAEELVQFGNTAEAECAAILAPALVTLTEGEDSMIASAIETALAIEGGLMMQMVSVLRGEVDVAATEGGATPASTQPSQPVMPGAILNSGDAQGRPATRQHRTDPGSFGGNMTELPARNRTSTRVLSALDGSIGDDPASDAGTGSGDDIASDDEMTPGDDMASDDDATPGDDTGGNDDTDYAELPDHTLPDLENDRDVPTDVSRVN